MVSKGVTYGNAQRHTSIPDARLRATPLISAASKSWVRMAVVMMASGITMPPWTTPMTLLQNTSC